MKTTNYNLIQRNSCCIPSISCQDQFNSARAVSFTNSSCSSDPRPILQPIHCRISLYNAPCAPSTAFELIFVTPFAVDLGPGAAKPLEWSQSRWITSGLQHHKIRSSKVHFVVRVFYL